MEERNTVAHRAIELAYATPQVVPKRRTKPSGIPGWIFDATVVGILLLLVAAYFVA